MTYWYEMTYSDELMNIIDVLFKKLLFNVFQRNVLH